MIIWTNASYKPSWIAYVGGIFAQTSNTGDGGATPVGVPRKSIAAIVNRLKKRPPKGATKRWGR